MSRNRYLYEDMRDLRIAYERFASVLLEASKPLLLWLLDKLNKLYEWIGR